MRTRARTCSAICTAAPRNTPRTAQRGAGRAACEGARPGSVGVEVLVPEVGGDAGLDVELGTVVGFHEPRLGLGGLPLVGQVLERVPRLPALLPCSTAPERHDMPS